MYTKEDWKGKAVKLAALWALLGRSDSGKVTLTDALVFESLTATAKSVAEMLRDEDRESEEDPTEEKLHEMMEQAAKEICDEQ